MGASRSSSRWTWAPGTRQSKKLARALGVTLQHIRSRAGTWTAADVVNAARPQSSLIHKMFEWDDSRAAELFRESQARSYVRSLVIEVVTPKGPRTMPAAVSFGPGEGYQDTPRVLASSELRERLLAQALGEAQSWAQRYRYLRELAAVFGAIKRARLGRPGLKRSGVVLAARGSRGSEVKARMAKQG